MKILEKEKEQNLSNSIDELEDNIFLEFKSIVEDVSKEINEKIVSAIVTTPLDATLEKYEAQIPKLTDSVEHIKNVSSFMEKTKKELYKNIDKAIGEISYKIIEDSVLVKLDEVYKKYEVQIPIIDESTQNLYSLIKSIKKAEQEITGNVQKIVAEVSQEVLEKEVVYKFTKLYEDYMKQLPHMEKTSKELTLLVEQVNEARTNIYNNINNVFKAMSSTITNSIKERLDILYEKYEVQVRQLEKGNKELYKVVHQLSQRNREMLEVTNSQMEQVHNLQKEVEFLKEQTVSLNKKLDENAEKQQKMLYGIYVMIAFTFIGVFL
ncbi:MULTISPECIES: hypothetical protein [Bacillus cereus group]|uniref:hypothetical protein n=1 Tax=Bacillus cereus group TaxID=86661 RepID=UPI001F471592|nr:hypothetical protein [Bacillus cereus]MDA1521403.1 hypothetical protein [Bacillus cereus]BCC16606.1 hypothetical protein BCM0075_1376 [Bacillus cereus]BCD08803.1 hypothetical protein BC30052_p2085 [Bacillus cereus]HDR7980140.1 hypothetical protein [Bacillus cereus]HDR8059878.1 hypothetical protein [Bacillus cereus]